MSQQSHLLRTRDDSHSHPQPQTPYHHNKVIYPQLGMILSHSHPQPHAPRYHNKIIYPQLGMIFTSTPGMIHSHPQPHASPHKIVTHPQLGMILFHLALFFPCPCPSAHWCNIYTCWMFPCSKLHGPVPAGVTQCCWPSLAALSSSGDKGTGNNSAETLCGHSILVSGCSK